MKAEGYNARKVTLSLFGCEVAQRLRRTWTEAQSSEERLSSSVCALVTKLLSPWRSFYCRGTLQIALAAEHSSWWAMHHSFALPIHLWRKEAREREAKHASTSISARCSQPSQTMKSRYSMRQSWREFHHWSRRSTTADQSLPTVSYPTLWVTQAAKNRQRRAFWRFWYSIS